VIQVGRAVLQARLRLVNPIGRGRIDAPVKTQNTAWVNVERALANLWQKGREAWRGEDGCSCS